MESVPSDEPSGPHGSPSGRRRRPRYRGTHPRRFEERYKEHDTGHYPEIVERVRARGGTPAGTHVPILLADVMETLCPAPGEVVADCTLGYGGHAAEFLRRIGTAGQLVGFDLDAAQLARTGERLRVEFPDHRIDLHHGNYAGLDKGLRGQEVKAWAPSPHAPPGYDIIFADLGVSSMQVDDPARGFSYKHDGPLDMRMNPSRARTAAGLLASLSEQELRRCLSELGDEPDAAVIARMIVQVRSREPIDRTTQLAGFVLDAKGLSRRRWREELMRRERGPHAERVAPGERLLHPAARTFQALRMLVNDELGSLAQLLRVAPYCLRPGGRIGIITFHSGEDRLVEQALRDGVQAGLYAEGGREPVRPSGRERFDNPRSRSARFRWARRIGEGGGVP